MSITHHPTEETLEAYARGALDVGRQVVVSAHLELCGSCRRLMAALDDVGGLQLEQLSGTPLAEDSLPRTMMRLDELPRSARPVRTVANDLPLRLQALESYQLGPWRWIGPGVYQRSTSVPDDSGSRVFLLKAAPGTRLPDHTHTGSELTLVLKGAFSHAGGRFGVGDFDDADDSVEHQPVVEAGQDCICLVAMQGQLRLMGLMGRLLQPFVRM
jgi:putative transcriptional regulator